MNIKICGLVAAVFGAAADGQTPAFTCVNNVGVPPVLRSEGIAELVGEVILTCTGGTPTAAGEDVPRNNIQIFLNTNLTSRWVADPLSEVLLLIDEPAPAKQIPCIPAAGLTSCPIAGTSAGVDYLAGGVPNVYQATDAAANSVVWLGVPIDPPGPNATRTIRFVNIRANVNLLSRSTAIIFNSQVVMFISITGSTGLPINPAQQTVGYFQPGLTFSFRGPGDDTRLITARQCVNRNLDLASDPSKTCPQSKIGELNFRENLASAFKTRLDPGGSQAEPGVSYKTESGFYNPAFTGNGLASAGLADSGTRLSARFSNVPAGVLLYVGGNEHLRLVSSNPAPSACALGPIAPINIVNGTGTAIWEVIGTDPLQVETFVIDVIAAWAPNSVQGLPGLGTVSVNGNFAPISTLTAVSATAPVPRFDDSSRTLTAFTIASCLTNLLFPFLTNRQGFDSGFVIANTSADPFGTARQQGFCTLNYYGESAPAAQKSGPVPPGAQLVATLSSGGNFGIAPTPRFQGYMIAQCGFQFAHGYAFISDLGASKVAESYLAFVMDGQLTPRTGATAESLAQ